MPEQARAIRSVPPPALPRLSLRGSAHLMDAVSIAVGESPLIRA
ncbi:hypothetical protein [Methylobacterium sp. ID0610]